MASLKNSPGEYNLQQKSFRQTNEYLTYKYSQIPTQSKLPGLGINPGNMRGGFYNNILSSNPSNIESNLFGIRQIDLTKPKSNFKPCLNKLNEQTFFQTPDVLFLNHLLFRKIKDPLVHFQAYKFI